MHQPVMPKEVVEYLHCNRSGIFVDCTCGLGGHAEAILEASAPNGRLVAVDRDAEALELARRRLERFGARVRFIHDNFRNLPSLLDRLEIAAVDGILLDLGLSSFQLSNPKRGFSFQEEGPLDMRMDCRQKVTAEDLVNHLNEKELADLIWRLGEERASRRIARAIVASRDVKPIQTTVQLVEAIRKGHRVAAGKRKHLHPATRTFQALRIAVNEELENLQGILDQAMQCLIPSGRLVVISFHSLEDRMVKSSFRRFAGYPEEGSVWEMVPVQNQAVAHLPTRKAIKAGEEEVERNPRSRSARLRAVEKQ